MMETTQPLPYLEPTVSRWQRFRSQIGEQGMLFAFIVPALGVLLVTQAYPLAYSAYFSLFDWTLSRSPVPGAFIGLDNYLRVFGDPVFGQAVATTLIFALSATLFEMILGFFLAYITVGEKVGLQIARTILIMPMVIAPVAVGTMWRMLLSGRAGLINAGLAAIGIQGPDWLGDPNTALLSIIMIDIWQWSPFVMIIFVAAITSLPSDPFRAATVDGASRWQIFRHITLPLLTPITLLVLMFRLIDTLLTLDIVYTTTFGGPGFRTHTLTFWIYQQGLRYFNISYAAASSWVLLITCVLIAALFLVVRRRLTRWQG